MTEPKGKCKCNIRGVVKLFKIKNGLFYSIHPEYYVKWWRKFKFCPLCGKKLFGRKE